MACECCKKRFSRCVNHKLLLKQMKVLRDYIAVCWHNSNVIDFCWSFIFFRTFQHLRRSFEEMMTVLAIPTKLISIIKFIGEILSFGNLHEKIFIRALLGDFGKLIGCWAHSSGVNQINYWATSVRKTDAFEPKFCVSFVGRMNVVNHQIYTRIILADSSIWMQQWNSRRWIRNGQKNFRWWNENSKRSIQSHFNSAKVGFGLNRSFGLKNFAYWTLFLVLTSIIPFMRALA